LPLAVVEGVRAACTCEIYHLSRWHDGALRTARDEDILTVARESELAVVTGDVGTIPATAYRWMREDEPPGLVVFVPSRMLRSRDVGGLVRALVELCPRLAQLDPAYPVVYLRPSP
jgi:hypothetical protein